MGTWVWFLWFGLIWTSFAVFEGYALRHPERMWTLSRLVSTIGAKWPLSIALLGFLFGGLLVHFFWPYDNPLGHVQGWLVSSAVAQELPPMPKSGQIEGTVHNWSVVIDSLKVAWDGSAWLIPWVTFFVTQASAWFKWPNTIPFLRILAGNYGLAENAKK
jgi:hypothetical protein